MVSCGFKVPISSASINFKQRRRMVQLVKYPRGLFLMKQNSTKLRYLHLAIKFQERSPMVRFSLIASRVRGSFPRMREGARGLRGRKGATAFQQHEVKKT